MNHRTALGQYRKARPVELSRFQKPLESHIPRGEFHWDNMFSKCNLGTYEKHSEWPCQICQLVADILLEGLVPTFKGALWEP